MNDYVPAYGLTQRIFGPERPSTSACADVWRGLATVLAKSIHRVICDARQRLVGWCFTNTGVWKSLALAGEAWERLPERPPCSNAAPFPLTWQGAHSYSSQEIDHRTNKSVIAALEFTIADWLVK